MSHNSLFDLHYSIFEILKSNIKWNRVFVKLGALRSKISREMYNLYSKKVIEFQTKNNIIQNNMITPSSQENTIVSNQSDESFSDYKKKNGIYVYNL